MADRFLQGIFADCFRGVTSPITATSTGGASVPANALTVDDGTTLTLDDGTILTTD